MIWTFMTTWGCKSPLSLKSPVMVYSLSGGHLPCSFNVAQRVTAGLSCCLLLNLRLCCHTLCWAWQRIVRTASETSMFFKTTVTIHNVSLITLPCLSEKSRNFHNDCLAILVNCSVFSPYRSRVYLIYKWYNSTHWITRCPLVSGFSLWRSGCVTLR